jgi:hypothetical protein
MALPAHSGPRPHIQFRNNFYRRQDSMDEWSAVARCYLHTGQHKQNKCTQTPNIHALSGIRTHDPSVRAGENSSYLRPRGHRDRQLFTLILFNNCYMFRSTFWTIIRQDIIFQWHETYLKKLPEACWKYGPKHLSVIIQNQCKQLNLFILKYLLCWRPGVSQILLIFLRMLSIARPCNTDWLSDRRMMNWKGFGRKRSWPVDVLTGHLPGGAEEINKIYQSG